MASENETVMDEIQTVHPVCPDAMRERPVLSKLELAEQIALIAHQSDRIQRAHDLLKRLSNTDSAIWADSREPVLSVWR